MEAETGRCPSIQANVFALYSEYNNKIFLKHTHTTYIVEYSLTLLLLTRSLIFVLFCFVFVCRDRVYLCSFGAFLGTHSGDQAGLELTEIHLPIPPECWD